MSMYYVEEHLNCDCYSRGEFQSLNIVKYSKGEQKEQYHKKIRSYLFYLVRFLCQVYSLFILNH